MEIMACWKSAAVTRTLSSELRDDCCGFHQARREGERERGKRRMRRREKKNISSGQKSSVVLLLQTYDVISNYYYT